LLSSHGHVDCNRSSDYHMSNYSSYTRCCMVQKQLLIRVSVLKYVLQFSSCQSLLLFSLKFQECLLNFRPIENVHLLVLKMSPLKHSFNNKLFVLRGELRDVIHGFHFADKRLSQLPTLQSASSSHIHSCPVSRTQIQYSDFHQFL